MATTERYTMDQFVADAQRVMGAANGDRQRVVRELSPLVERVVWDDGLFDARYRAEPEGGRPRYLYHTEPDGSLQVYMVEFAPGMPTPVHDHVTWGLIGICGGEQKTSRYSRLDDGSDPEQAELKLIEEETLGRGAVYPLLPPEDIHRIETVGDRPSYSLHVLGADLRRQHRHIFDVDSGSVTAVDGQGM
ncbi:MAG TPA: cysteine dioxygenase family protein [Thermomicrobiaceae bacterium]|nr:cysteine dioxygenase family protein [Thermomicrobiaceae bacterium]